ncbi:MAG: hypothetical protein ACHQIO_01270 [Nevskiales bacterium]
MSSTSRMEQAAASPGENVDKAIPKKLSLKPWMEIPGGSFQIPDNDFYFVATGYRSDGNRCRPVGIRFLSEIQITLPSIIGICTMSRQVFLTIPSLNRERLPGVGRYFGFTAALSSPKLDSPKRE